MKADILYLLSISEDEVEGGACNCQQNSSSSHDVVDGDESNIKGMNYLDWGAIRRHSACVVWLELFASSNAVYGLTEKKASSNLERVCFHFLLLHTSIRFEMLCLCTQSESFGSHLFIKMTENVIITCTKRVSNRTGM